MSTPSTKDGWFSAAVSVGNFVDAKEHAAVRDVFERVNSGELGASAQAKKVLDDFVKAGPDSRWRHALRGGSAGKALAIGAGSLLGLGWGVLGVYGVGVPAGLLIGAIWAGIGAAAGYLVGAAHAVIDD